MANVTQNAQNLGYMLRFYGMKARNVWQFRRIVICPWRGLPITLQYQLFKKYRGTLNIE